MVTHIIQRYSHDLDTYIRGIVSNYVSQDMNFDLMLRYAMGWVDEKDKPYDKATGKRLRPTILLLCSEASGGNWQHALPAASAVELLHNFSLIHDDIQDASDFRHNRPTVWKVWGMPNAINAGDAMFALAYTSMHRLSEHHSPDLAIKAWEIFNRTNIELTRGQHLDMRFETINKVSPDDYISMIKGKTAALLAACSQMGALLSGTTNEIAKNYYDFGLNIGIAFQIHDDILGIWGEPDVTGKSAATDIISQKKSIPVLYGLEQSPQLAELYAKPNLSDTDVQRVIELLDEVGAETYTRQQETFYHDKALSALESANPQGEAAQMLYQLVDFLFERQH